MRTRPDPDTDSFTGPEVLVRMSSPAFVSNGENGIRGWLSPILSTPIGLQFDYTAIAVSDDAPSLLNHRPTAVLYVDGRGPIEIGGATSSSAGYSYTVFHAPDPHLDDNSGRRVLDVHFTDPLAGATHEVTVTVAG
ncbi:hypothetical protein [Nocardia sp. NPDC004750]